jgi:hypothetical protein
MERPAFGAIQLHARDRDTGKRDINGKRRASRARAEIKRFWERGMLQVLS